MAEDPQTDAEMIGQLWPELAGSSMRKLGEGWMSRALLVDDRFVFRLAKHDDAARDTHKEIRLLPRLAATLSTPIPQFAFVAEQPRSGLPIVGYRCLPGQPLTERAAATLASPSLGALAEDVARFLDQLHRFAPSEARELGVPESNFRAAFADDRAELRGCGVHLDQDVARYVEARFAAYLDDDAHFAFTPALIHADLSPDHLLVQGHEPRLSGIIDFGDASIGDPDYEYLYLLSDLGDEFVRRVLAARGHEPHPARMHKISLFRTFDHVHSILGGVHYGRPELIQEGVEGLTSEARGTS